MSERLILPPEVAASVLATAEALNPGEPDTLGAVVIIVRDGHAPEMISNMPPAALYSVLHWLTEHESVAKMEAHIVNEPN